MRINGVCTGPNGNSYSTWIEITTLEQDNVGNYSKVNMKLYLQSKISNSAYNLSGNNYRWITAHTGVAPTGSDGRSANGNIDTRGLQLVLLKDETFTIPHEINGKKTFNFDAGFYISSNSLASGRVEGSVELKTIPRASHPTFNDIVLQKDDLIIKTNRASKDFLHVIDFWVDGVKILSRDNIEEEIIIKFSDAETDQIYELLKNKTSAMTMVGCTTWNGNQQVDYIEARQKCTLYKDYIDSILMPGFIQGTSYKEYDTETYKAYVPKGNVRGSTNIWFENVDFFPRKKAIMKKLRLDMGTNFEEKDWIQFQPQDLKITTPLDVVNSYTLSGIDSRGIQSTIAWDIEPSMYTKPNILKCIITRENGIEAKVLLNMEIDFQQYVDGIYGELTHDYQIKYMIGENVYDATSFAKESSEYDEENQILKLNDVQLHKNGSSGGFPIGEEFDIKIIFYNGVPRNSNEFVIWDTNEFFSYITDGSFLDGHKKGQNGDYHSGYHCLPTDKYHHEFDGSVNFKNNVYVNEKPILPIEDTGWKTVSTVLQYRKVGRVVTLRGVSGGQVIVGAGNYTNIGTLPSEARPNIDMMFPWSNYGAPMGNQSSWCYTNGNVVLYLPAGSQSNYWGFVLTYIV